MMRAIGLGLLLACSKADEDKRPDPPRPPPGVLRGTVTVTYFPGMDTEPYKPIVRVGPCAVTARRTHDGSTIRAMADQNGAYELQLPPGDYRIDFSACGPCEPADVVATSGQVHVFNQNCIESGK